ncbi:MAG: hypothetical protein H7Z16_07730 [Pyrinomonadaceae bacterium]|nr:hypothetical protein [Pyrinomonadaceae bacterium]
MKEYSTKIVLIFTALAVCSATALGNLQVPQRPGALTRDVDDPVLAPGRRVARAAEPYSYTPARRSNTDRDADGIPDDLEQRLLDKFAPVFKYDAKENVYPIKVGDYLGQVFLMFAHRGCEDHAVLSIGEVNLRSLLRQVHPIGCDHRLGSAASNAPVPRLHPFLKPEFYYMSLSTCVSWSTACQRQAEGDCPDNPDPACHRAALNVCHREFLRQQREAMKRGDTIGAGEQCEDVGISRGFNREDKVEAYASVRPSKKLAGAYEIFVKLFYPQNTMEALGFGYHVGDWEGVSIHVTRDERAFYVTYPQHEGGQAAHRSPTDPRGEWRSVAFRERWVPKFEGDTHLVVYVAAKSHASYPVSGTDGRGALPADHHNGNNSFVLRTRGRIVNVGSTAHPFPGSEWIEYRGYWGQDWDPATFFVDLEGASPPTPAF